MVLCACLQRVVAHVDGVFVPGDAWTGCAAEALQASFVWPTDMPSGIALLPAMICILVATCHKLREAPSVAIG